MGLRTKVQKYLYFYAGYFLKKKKIIKRIYRHPHSAFAVHRHICSKSLFLMKGVGGETEENKGGSTCVPPPIEYSALCFR